MRLPSGPDLLRRGRHFLKPARKAPGAEPGTLIYEGEMPSHPATIEVIDFDADYLEEAVVDGVDACVRFHEHDTVTWINVEGVHDIDLVESLGALYGLHPLTLEDIVSTDQRPKLEEYPEYLYVVLQMMHYDHESGTVEPEQVSLVFGERFLLSFQEGQQGDVFGPVRQRLRDDRGLLRKRGADHLAYALIDVIVDYYMEILEGLGDHIEALEDEITQRPDAALLRDINTLRRRVTTIRHSIWPLREVVLALERSERPFITEALTPYLRDVYDHTVRTVELTESAREILTSLVELHLSMSSHRMNEVMKVLTIIATFFLPLSFIAGIYGMNFNPEASPLNMPELDWFWGYPFVWGLMLVVAALMYTFFRRKGWL